MSDQPPQGAAPAEKQTHEYKLVSASYRDKAYPDCVLVIDEPKSEMELRQWVGKKKKRKQVAVERFRMEAAATLLVDGPRLVVSELSMTLESSAIAAEVAGMLRRPTMDREAATAISEAEAALAEFLVSREQAVTFLMRVKANPREALLGAESLWSAGDSRGPLEAVYSSYSARLAETLEKMKASIEEAGRKMNPAATERIFALACTLGEVQNALLQGDFKQSQELAALQELGVATTSQDLQMEKPTERILTRAHPSLVELAAAAPPSG